MKLNIILFAGAAIGAIGLAAPLASQGNKDAALDAACRSTEVTAPESCPCTITAARNVGLNDTELASLFKDDGHSQPVDQAKYGRFWQVKSQCIADATMAKMGITPGNPLPGVPANMRPGAPFPPANTPVPPIARAGRSMAPARAAATTAQMPQVGRRTVADIEAMIVSLRDTAWEYRASRSEGGKRERIDFLADGNLVIFRSSDRNNAQDSSVNVFHIFAEPGEYGASIRLNEVDSGTGSTLQIVSLSDTVLTIEERYARSSEEMAYRKVGKADPGIPASGPQRLEDGFWRVRFDRGDNNPLFLNRQQLSGYVNGANREIRSASLMNAPERLYLVGPKDSQACESTCNLVLNNFDFRSNRVRGRLIDEAGVDSVGIRVEAADNRGRAAASLRVSDGFGGWKEWLCTQGAGLDCRKTGERAPRPAATVSTAGLAERLGAVNAEVYGENACATDWYLAPADRSLLRSVNALDRYISTNASSRIGTLVDVRGSEMPGLKLKIDGRERVLPATGDNSWNSWSAAGVRFVFHSVGEPIYDHPAYGFTPGTATLTIDGQAQTIDLIANGAC